MSIHTENPPRGLRALLNPAGALTLARFPLSVVFIAVADRLELALAVYLLGITTDVIDGRVARWTGTTSQAGAVADGVADKVFQGTVAICLVAARAMPAWWLLLWFSREVVGVLLTPLLWLGLRRRPERLRKANSLGKATTVMLALACIATMIPGPHLALVLSVVTGALGVATAVSYGLREWRPEVGHLPRNHGATRATGRR